MDVELKFVGVVVESGFDEIGATADGAVLDEFLMIPLGGIDRYLVFFATEGAQKKLVHEWIIRNRPVERQDWYRRTPQTLIFMSRRLLRMARKEPNIYPGS